MAHLATVLALRGGNSPSKGASQILRTGTLLTIFIFINLENRASLGCAPSLPFSFFSRETTYSHGKYLFPARPFVRTALTSPLWIEIEGFSPEIS